MDTTRRRFIGSLAAPAFIPAGSLGRGTTPPNSRINIGIIGTGNRAMFEGKHFVPIDACEVVAVCDVQETRRVEGKATFEKLYAERGKARNGIRMYNDFRELLAQRDIDAVYIVTPDHWHVPILIQTLKAGKSVHCEKPLGVSIEQDLAALRAARKYRSTPFFYGPERRSTPDARHALELVLNGRIGDVKEIYVAAPPSKAGGSASPVLPVPKGWDYDMWLGPAPEAPFCADRFGEGIFHIYDYCLGFISNWGTHPLDQLQWWADNSGLTIPVTYEGTAAFPESGLYNCATAWDLRCTYANGLVVRYMDGTTFNRRTDLPPNPLGRRNNNVTMFVGTKGTVAIAYERVATEPASLKDEVIGPEEKHLMQSPIHTERITGKGVWDYPAAAHQLAWIESMQSHKQGVHTIETAVRTDLFCQLCDLCTRTGKPVRWDEKEQTIIGNDEARKRMSRPMRAPWNKLA